MMMNTSKKPAFNITPGTIITGKWQHHSYTILKTLGFGATGTVYLAQGKRGLVALKISEDHMAITSEVNVLRHFSKVQGCLGPSLLDVDDWDVRNIGKTLPFYVMEYLKGEDFLSYLKKHGNEWLIVLVLQLLADLEKLHKEGWIFGDLKPDNLIVVGPPPRVRWLDVGGTTKMGRSIKEFTEFYDRGYWNLGTRKAEPSYDLFAVAMVMINACYPQRFSKKDESRHLPQLIKAIQSAPLLKRYEKVIVKALQSRYHSAQDMRNELMEVANGRIDKRKPIRNEVAPSSITQTKAPSFRQKQRDIKRKEKYRGIFETMIIAILLIVAYFLYIAGHIM